MTMTQPYDRFLKSVASDDPRSLYYLLQGSVPPPEAVIRPIVQELDSKKIILDCGFTVESEGVKRADIFEFKAQYSNSARQQILDYALMTYLELRLPVHCTLVIVYPDNLPLSYSDLLPIEEPGIISVQFHTVKLWEIDPERVLQAERPNLLSVLPLLRTNRQQMVEGARRVCQAGSDDALRWFKILATIKYDESGVKLLFEEAQVNAAVMEKLYRELYPLSPRGKREIEQDRQEGRLTEARNTIRHLMARRFPLIEIPEALNSVNDLDLLHTAWDALFEAATDQKAAQLLSGLVAAKPPTE